MAEKGAKDPGDASPDQLRGFLVELATDPAALGRFVKDPETTMADAGLGADDQAVLRSGDPATINTRLVVGPGSAATPALMLVVDVTPGAGGAPEQVSVRQGPFTLVQARPVIHAQFAAQAPFTLVQARPVVHAQFAAQGPFTLVQARPVIHAQFAPQVFPTQFHPQVVYPQVVAPQFHPQVVHPQIVHPQIHPQLAFPLPFGQ